MQSKKLTFPSASAIEYYKGKLFVFGDDAPYSLVTDTAFRVTDTIAYLSGKGRIPKYSKPDVESVFLDSSNGRVTIEAWSSGSAANRNFQLQIDANTNSLLATDSFAYKPFVQRSKAVGALNIEGLVRLPQGWLAANRANLSQAKSWVLFWTTDPFNTPPTVKELVLHMPAGAGVSALAYQKEKDRLFFVVSEEATSSATGDGAIGESWLCWTDAISDKIKSNTFAPSQKIKLTTVDKSLHRQKIEGITLQQNGNNLNIYLCADNDDGLSSFFQLRWQGAGK